MERLHSASFPCHQAASPQSLIFQMPCYCELETGAANEDFRTLNLHPQTLAGGRTEQPTIACDVSKRHRTGAGGTDLTRGLEYLQL